MKKLAIALPLCLLFLLSSVGSPQAQSNLPQYNTSLVGTWYFETPMGNGAKNTLYISYSPSGQYSMVTYMVGGPSSGQEFQAFGRYQAERIGDGRYRVNVQITDQAPRRMCGPMMGCQPIPRPPDIHDMILTVRGTEMRESTSSMPYRLTVLPPDLARRLPDSM